MNKGKLFYLSVGLILTGVFLSIFEIILGYSLYIFLAEFGLVKKVEKTNFIQSFLGSFPIIELIFVVLFVNFLRFLNNILPSLIHQRFTVYNKNILVNKLFSTQETFYSNFSEVNHFNTNLISKGADFFNSINIFITNFLAFLIFILGLFLINKYLAITIVFLIIVSGLFFLFLKRKNQQYISKVFELNKQYVYDFTKNFQNLIFIKIIGLVEKVTKRITKINNDSELFHKKYMNYHALNTIFPNIIGFLIIISLIISNFYFSFLTTDQLVPFVYILSRLGLNLSNINASMSHTLFNYYYFEDYIKKYKILKSIKNKSNNIVINKDNKFSLEVSNLSVGWKTKVLKNLNFSLKEGNLFLIKGRSGVGKTTLLNTLLGVIEKKGGKIKWMGKEFKSFSPLSLKGLVSYANADPFLVSGTVKENIFFGNEKKVDDKELEKAINITKCEFIFDLKKKFNSLLGESGDGISTGQKQRISILRSLLFKSKLIIFDEATSNIDFKKEKLILKNIRLNYPKICLIVVTHRDTLDDLADQIIDLNKY